LRSKIGITQRGQCVIQKLGCVADIKYHRVFIQFWPSKGRIYRQGGTVQLLGWAEEFMGQTVGDHYVVVDSQTKHLKVPSRSRRSPKHGIAWLPPVDWLWSNPATHWAVFARMMHR